MAQILGQLAAQLVLDDKGYSAGMAKADKANKTAEKSGRSLTSTLAVATKVIAGTAAAVGAVGAALLALGTRAGQMEGLTMGFERNFGDMTKGLNKLRKASMGTISDFSLMEAANKAALLGITTDVDDLVGLMQTARLRGREMGLSMTQAFDDIVTGIGRGSPLILDNLGIKIPDAVKKSMKEMNDAEKTVALLKFAIKDGANIAKEYGDVQLTTAEKIDRFKISMINLKDAIAQLVAPIAGELANRLSALASKIINVVKNFDTLKERMITLKDKVIKLLIKVFRDLNTTIRDSFGVDLAAIVKKAIDLFIFFKDKAIEKLLGIKKAIIDTFTIENIKGWYTTILNWISTIGNWFTEKIVNPMRNFWENNLKEIVVTAFNAITGFISEKFDIIKNYATETFENIKNFITEKFGNIKDSAAENFEEIKRKISETFTAENLKEWYNDFKDNLKKIKDEIQEKLIDPISEFWDNTLKPLFQLWKDIIDNQIIPAWNRLSALVNELFEAFGIDGEDSKEKMKNLAKVVGGILAGSITGALWLVARLMDLLSGIVWVITQFKKLSDWVKETNDKFSDWLGTIRRIADAISSFGITELGRAAVGKIKELLGFANGGEFTVGGSGGTDSQLVAFNATPGEKVTVETPAQQAQSKGGIVIEKLQVGNANDIPVVMNNLNWLYRRI